MTDRPESGPYRLSSSPSHLLHRAQQLAAERFAQLVGGAVTLRQFAVLAAIAERPGVSQSELVRATGVDRSTLAEMMTRMERRGWITRIPSASDARAHAVHLAPAGASLLEDMAQHARAADAAILDLLPRTKRRSFLTILMKLLKLADAAAEKAERRAKRAARRAEHRDGAARRVRGKSARKPRQPADRL